jgi:hypothetical protein
MPRKATACLALIAALLHGCADAPLCREGYPIAEYPGDECSRVTPLASGGDYGLYRRPAPAAGGGPSRAADSAEPASEPGELRGQFCLAGQGPVGFEEGPDGQLFARIGEEKIPLPPGRYCWRAIPDGLAPGEKPPVRQKVKWALCKVGEAATEVVLVVGVVALCAGLVALFVLASGNSSSQSPYP